MIVTLFVGFITLFVFLRTKKNFILFLPIINVISDSAIYFSSGSLLNTGDLRAIFVCAYIFHYFTNYKIKTSVINSTIILFFLYCILNILLQSSNISYSLQYSFKIFITLFLFIIAKNHINSLSQLSIFCTNIFIALLIQLCVTIFSNIFKIGDSQYLKDSFYEGTGGAPVVIILFSLITIPLFLFLKQIYSEKINKKIIISAVVISIVIILISMRRTTIASLLVTILFFALTHNNKKAVLKYITLMLTFLVALFPFFAKKLYDIYEFRFVKHSKTLDQEGRYKETQMVIKQIYNFDLKSFFGIEPFNSYGYNMAQFHIDRQFHTFHTILLHGVGIIGFTIYIALFTMIFIKIRLLRKKCKNYSLLYITSLILFFAYIVQIISFGIEIISLNSIVFIFIGAYIGITENDNNLNLIEQN